MGNSRNSKFMVPLVKKSIFQGGEHSVTVLLYRNNQRGEIERSMLDKKLNSNSKGEGG